MPAPQGLDTTWLVKFIRDNLTQNPLPAQALRNASSPAATAGSTITTSAASGGPPAAPSEGDIWIATGITTFGGSQGVWWQFAYDASFNVWRFIGGPPMFESNGNTLQNTADNVWQFVTGAPSITVPLAGTYVFSHSGRFFGNNAQDQYTDISNSAIASFLAQGMEWGVGQSLTANLFIQGASVNSGVLALSAGEVAKYVLQATAHTNTEIAAPNMSCVPIYVT